MNYFTLERIIRELDQLEYISLDRWIDDCQPYSETYLYEQLGEFELVAEDRDHMVGTAYYIWYFRDHDIYIKFNGYIASLRNDYFRNMEQVYPETTTKTIYKNV